MAKTSGAFAVADRVHHSEYGHGKVTVVNDRHTSIEFDDAGVKKFVTDLVQLTRSDSPSPVKPSRGGRPKGSKKA
jgi:hypothetical protein